MSIDAGRTEALATIDRHFYAIDGRLRRLNSVHQFDLNTILEFIYCGLLNLIFNWSLDNQNVQHLNSAGIDFADDTKHISVQLSSDETARKVRDTLDTFFQHNLHEKYDTLYIVFMGYGYPSITDYSANLKVGFQFNRDDHVLNHKTLYSKIFNELDTSKVKAIAVFLDEAMGRFPGIFVPPEEELPHPPCGSDFFITESRTEQINSLALLMQHPDPLVIWGDGGIGKTQIALKLVRDHSPELGAGYIKYIHSPTNGEESMFISILAANFHGGPFKDTDPHTRAIEFDERIRILKQYGKKAVLIIDDFWRLGYKMPQLMEEPSFTRLLQTNIHLILTTRFPYVNSKIPKGQPDPGHIVALDSEQLMEQIRHYSKNQTLTDDDLRPLLEVAECNTLAAFLICETLRDGSVFPKELQALFTSEFPAEHELPVFSDEYGENEGNICEHLVRLHDLSTLDNVAQQTLALALLACPEQFKTSAFTRSLADSVYRKRFQHLCLSGWIDSRDGLFRIAPMVRLAHRNTLKPETKILMDFLNKLCTQRNNPDLTEQNREQICTCCDAAMQHLNGYIQACHQEQELPQQCRKRTVII